MRARSISLVVLTILPLTAAPGIAQEPQDSVTAQLIEYGETTMDYLGAGSPVFQDQSYYLPYVFYGLEGEHVTVWLSSLDFNANLIVADRADSVIGSDDNSGGDCNANLQLVLPESGSYLIYANAAEPQESGQFQLTLLQGMVQPAETTPCRGYIGHLGKVPVGEAVQMTLGEGDRTLGDQSYFQVWLVDNPTGGAFTADLVSAEFDGLLMLVRGLREVVGHDDDGGGGCNARLAFTPTDDRQYRLVVVSRSPGRGGTYQLALTEGMLPTLTEPTCVPPGGE